MHTRYLLLALAMIFTPIAGKADILSDMIGNWKTNANAYVNGNFFASVVGTSKVTRYGKKGLYSVATVKVGNEPSGTSHIWMHDSGTCLGYVKQGSKTIGIIQGTWSAKGNVLTQKISAHTLTLDYTQTVTSKMINKKKFTSTSTTSYGATITGSATKK